MSAKESFSKTVGVVVGVCLVCSIIVASAAIGLRPQQKANAALDIQTNILEAAGLLDEAGKDIPKYFGENITRKFWDIENSKLLEEFAGFTTIEAVARDLDNSIKPANDFAKVLRRPNIIPVYFSKDSNGNVETVVMPVYGAGLWGMMRGFLAVGPDGVTTKNLVYYEHMETPGLGAEVLNPAWKALWNGKKLFNDNGEVAIKIVKGGAKQGDVHGVDGLSGATLTGNGVQATLDYWLSAEGYQAFLANKPWKS